MSPSPARHAVVKVLPWVLLVIAAVLLISGQALALKTDPNFETKDLLLPLWGIALVFGSTGGLIATRHPANPIGWIFLAASVAAGVGSATGAWADYYVQSDTGPDLLGRAAAEYGELSWMPFILLPTTFLLALFPDGHLLSPRWRPIAWCSGVGLGGAFVVGALIAGPIPDHPEVTNPFGIDHPIIDPLNGLMLLLIAIGMIGSSVSLVLRFRRSHGEERLQLKWLSLAGVIAVFTIVFGVLGYEELGAALANVLMMLSVMGLPLAAGIAILRYRLYDIDVVINRALVYGLLSALLGGVYLGAILLLQLVLESLTQGSGLAVAASTLATAALVRPARGRIQSVVDRRFFRSKYDAARTLLAFGSRLRDQVDLDTLQNDLRAVVAETMQPEHVSLWVPTPSAAGR